MKPLRFFCPGRPATAGSKTAVPMGARYGVIEAGTKQSRARKRSWRGDLRDAALDAMSETLCPFDTQPLDLTVVIVRARPTGHLGAGRNAGQLKDWATPLQPVQRPDATKILRAAEDALTGVVWADDSQIVKQTVYKAYGDQCGLPVGMEGMFVSVSVCAGYMGPQLHLAMGPTSRLAA